MTAKISKRGGRNGQYFGTGGGTALMKIEDYVYQQLTRTDEWASSETGNLRSQLFGDNEWSNVNAAEWIDAYEDAHLWHEDMGS